MKSIRIRNRLCCAAAAALLLTALPLPVLTASAGELLGQTTFDSGSGLPWKCAAESPAQLSFEISGGTYNVTVINPGGVARGGYSSSDCRFLYDGLTIAAEHTYHVHAEVTSSADGCIYAQLTDRKQENFIWQNGIGKTEDASDYTEEPEGAGWTPLPLKQNKTLVIDARFTASQTVEDALWEFCFGGAGEYNPTDCLPEGAVLRFDNVSLIDETSDEYDWVDAARPEHPVHVNQLGYLPDHAKTAVYHTGTEQVLRSQQAPDTTPFQPVPFFVIDAKTGETVFAGQSAAGELDASSGMYAAKLDFSELTRPGTYFISMDGALPASVSFRIDPDLYSGVLTNALNFFYQSRADEPIEASYITSAGQNPDTVCLAHQSPITPPDTAYIQDKWIRAYESDGSNVVQSSGTLDAAGGWYDGLSYSKTVAEGAAAVWLLQNMYEYALDDRTNVNVRKFDERTGMVVMPDSYRDTPPVLLEARHELSMLQSLMVGADYLMNDSLTAGNDTGKYEHMVYSAVQDSRWRGLAAKPWAYIGESDEYFGIRRIVRPPTTAATLQAAAVFAQGARLFALYDKEYAEELLHQAMTCYSAAQANPQLYGQSETIIATGFAGTDTDLTDEFYWAACELYAATGDQQYYDQLLASRCYRSGIGAYYDYCGYTGTTAFNQYSTAGCGTLTLALHPEMLREEDNIHFAECIQKAANYFVDCASKEAFGQPYAGEEYTQYPVTETGNFSGYANGYGFASNGAAANNAVMLAYAGLYSEDAAYTEAVLGALDYLFGRNAADTSYVTGYGEGAVQSPSHIFWAHELDSSLPYAPDGVLVSGPDSALTDTYMASTGMVRGETPAQLCYADACAAWSVNSCGLPLNASLAWLMSYAEELGAYAAGDLNADGAVTAADAVLLAKHLAGRAALTAKQYRAADLSGDGAVNAIDLTLLKRMLLA